MFYSVLAVAITVVGLTVVFFSLKVLIRRGWLFGWLRGMWGLLLVVLGLTLAMSAFDLYSYKQIVAEKSVATISFEQLGPQRYNAILVDSKGQENRYELAGDQWQLDARLLKWPSSMAAVGIKPGYRLDRISGRYYSLDKERNAERTVYALNENRIGVDVWEFFHERGRWLNLVDAVYGSATFVPMADDALYEVMLSHTGLLARPLNEPARTAIDRWE
ncbi:MAG: cation/multidrug efflux pump [Cellvibrionaceae bacterium]